MSLSRRELAASLPILTVAKQAQQSSPGTLRQKVYHGSQIPYAGDSQKKSREFFNGADHSGFHLEMHETILGRAYEHTHRINTSTKKS